MATRTKKPSSESIELELLRAKLNELESRLSGNTPSKDADIISTDEYVSVMSLLPYPLNLSTKEGGQGSIKKFTKFGEIKQVLYRDLVDIIEVHRNFLEAGYFYILHPGIIRQLGLDELYSKILTKEKIEELLLTNSEECVTLYNSANDKQREIILQLLVDKVRDNPDSANLNVIDKISRASKFDIVKRAEEEKSLLTENANN